MLLEEISLPTVYSFRNTSALSSKTEGIGTKVTNAHTKSPSCWRWVQVYLSATDVPKSILLKQTNPDNQKYALVSLLSESFTFVSLKHTREQMKGDVTSVETQYWPEFSCQKDTQLTDSEKEQWEQRFYSEVLYVHFTSTSVRELHCAFSSSVGSSCFTFKGLLSRRSVPLSLHTHLPFCKTCTIKWLDIHGCIKSFW